jgi:hypothetical protein
MCIADFTSGIGKISTAITNYVPGGWDSQQPLCVTHAPVTGKDYVWVFGMTAITANQWVRYDIDSNIWERKTGPGSAAPNQGYLTWDGGDFIYAMPTTANSAFYKYQISTDSWTSLTATPVVKSGFATAANLGFSHTVYLPASVTGFSEDVIYTWLVSTSTTIYRYNVTSNTWGPSITMPFTPDANTFMVWDKAKYMYAMGPNRPSPFNQWYRSDVTVNPNAWTNLGILQQAIFTPMGGALVNHIVSKVQGSDLIPGAYFITGDADYISVVTRVGADPVTAKYYWMHFGRYTPAYRTTVRTLTAPAVPGLRATLNVDSSAGYVQGESFTLWDPVTGTSERVTIYDVPTGSSYRVVQLLGAFGTGTRLGTDPSQQAISGDTAQACAPLGAKGKYKADYQSANYHTVAAARTDLGAPSGRGAYVPVPIQLEDPYTGLNKEVLGTLKGAFYINKAAYPAPQPEDLLTVGGAQYKYFPLDRCKLFAGINYGLVIGPIA